MVQVLLVYQLFLADQGIPWFLYRRLRLGNLYLRLTRKILGFRKRRLDPVLLEHRLNRPRQAHLFCRIDRNSPFFLGFRIRLCFLCIEQRRKILGIGRLGMRGGRFFENVVKMSENVEKIVEMNFLIETA